MVGASDAAPTDHGVATGSRTGYHLQRNEWSIHFNVSRDGRLSCGDRGDPGRVERIENRGVAGTDLIQPGVIRAEKLVNMSKHRYRLEPDVTFAPDGKWVVFRSNMFRPTNVFAVEVERGGR